MLCPRPWRSEYVVSEDLCSLGLKCCVHCETCMYCSFGDKPCLWLFYRSLGFCAGVFFSFLEKANSQTGLLKPTVLLSFSYTYYIKYGSRLSRSHTGSLVSMRMLHWEHIAETLTLRIKSLGYPQWLGRSFRNGCCWWWYLALCQRRQELSKGKQHRNKKYSYGMLTSIRLLGRTFGWCSVSNES